MKPILFFYTLLLSFTSSYGQFVTKMQIEYSKTVGDSFEIYISLPPAYNLKDTYNVIYYCDANLKSGKHLREVISTDQYNDLRHSIFVGIGHIGKYRVLRRRDFILPAINGKDTMGKHNNYGQIEKFYSYLKNELIPSINSKLKTNADSTSILGHSLGGLFVFYCLFKSENLFSNYFALSPALWIHKYSIYEFNRIQDKFGQKKYLYFAAGSREWFNRILKGTNKAKQFFDKKQYGNFFYDYDIWKGKAHHSAFPMSLEKILKERM